MLPNPENPNSERNIEINIDADGNSTYTIEFENDYQTCIENLRKLFVSSNVDCLNIVPQIIYHLWNAVGKKKSARKVKAKYCPDMMGTDYNYLESLYIASILLNALLEATCSEDSDSNSEDN